MRQQSVNGSIQEGLHRIREAQLGSPNDKGYDEILADVKAARRNREAGVNGNSAIGRAFGRMKKAAICFTVIGAIGAGALGYATVQSYKSEVAKIHASELAKNPNPYSNDEINTANIYLGPHASEKVNIHGNFERGTFSKTITSNVNKYNYVYLKRPLHNGNYGNAIDAYPSDQLRSNPAEGQKYIEASIAVANKDGYQLRFSPRDMKTFDLSIISGPQGQPTVVTQSMVQALKDNGMKPHFLSQDEGSGNVTPSDMLPALKKMFERRYHQHEVAAEAAEQAQKHMSHEGHQHESHLPSHDSFGIGMGTQ